MRTHTIGFGHAWQGIIHAFTHHPNFLVHLFLGTSALLAGLLLHISRFELLILLSLFVLGLVVEMVNTAIESVVDLVTQEWRQSAKLAKDISSGAMLIYAVGSSIIALSILVPKLLTFYFHF